jgi:hypothetical protein
VTDQPEAPTEALQSPQATLSQELNASLASVWARYAGSRPADASVIIDGSVVRWTLPGGKAELESGMSETNDALEPGQPTRTLHGYVRETSAAVSRATRCPVRARISKQDKVTGAASETFILEAPTRKY